ncbi:hypothetical protein [Nocardia sp. NBC_01329]|uniref:hypothetical protein n=1 Tax=Nocardia sp. NBC_01329 TaxID=2903594 RepID=UPI002E1553F1|nr:hypothetical protein OG405_09225 [Nocardia sp. NBC_01329]
MPNQHRDIDRTEPTSKDTHPGTAPYLVTRSLDPTGAGRARWTIRWKPAVNAFAITFADRWPDARTY